MSCVSTLDALVLSAVREVHLIDRHLTVEIKTHQ